MMSLFETKEYLEVFKRHFCQGSEIVDEAWEVYKGKLVLVGMKPVLGGEEVTDYGEVDVNKPLPEGYKEIELDYVREDGETYRKFKDRGEVEKQEVSPRIELPGSWEEYLESLKRRYRKELRRKISKLTGLGYEMVEEDKMEEFVRLHRLSDRNKEKFMSEQMAKFFKDVYEAKIPGWKKRLDFIKIEGKYVAGIFSFVSQDEWWLYNSGFDPEYGYLSAGLVLKALSIKEAIRQRKKVYDFLRGGERYKYELGGKDLQLYKIRIK